MEIGQHVRVTTFARVVEGQAARPHPYRCQEGTIVGPAKGRRKFRYVVRFRCDGAEVEMQVQDLLPLGDGHPD